MHEFGDLETAEDTMPTHTTIDHLDDALQRLAKAERVCAGLQESYLHVCDQNANLRARVAELQEALQEVYEVLMEIGDHETRPAIIEAIITAEAALDGNDVILAMAMEAAEHDRT